jgi:hypothetical protein
MAQLRWNHKQRGMVSHLSMSLLEHVTLQTLMLVKAGCVVDRDGSKVKAQPFRLLVAIASCKRPRDYAFPFQKRLANCRIQLRVTRI